MQQQIINAFKVTLQQRAEKDAQRFKLFFEEVGRKQGEFLAEAFQGDLGSIGNLTLFNQEAMNLTTAYINRGAQVGKNPWKYIFSDPFRGEREMVRVFARKWSLSQELR